MPFDEEGLDPHGECAAEITQQRKLLVLGVSLLAEARNKFIHKHATYARDNAKWNCILCNAWGEVDGGVHDPKCLVARIDAALWRGEGRTRKGRDDGHGCKWQGRHQRDRRVLP